MSVCLRSLCVACAIVLFGLTGCLSWSQTAGDGSRTTHILGYARVRRPATWSSGEPPQISAVSCVGVSVGSDGLLLGYADRTLVALPPTQHGYVFVDVRSEEDLQRVLEVIRDEQIKEYPLCLTIDVLAAGDQP